MALRNILGFPKRFASHPLGRGMVAYGLTFPTGYLIQEFYNKNKLENINWKKCMRYSLYGSLVTAPMLFGWVNIANRMFPKRNLSTAVRRAVIEQILYAPVAISLFFVAMAAFDNTDTDKITSEISENVKRKFWDAYKVGLCYWPIVQTINFTFVPYHNRIVFVSLCGLLWVVFLAHVDTHGSALKPKLEPIVLYTDEHKQ